MKHLSTSVDDLGGGEYKWVAQGGCKGGMFNTQKGNEGKLTTKLKN